MSEEQEALNWWTDPRVESERRILLAAVFCVIGGLALLSSHEEVPETKDPVTPASGPESTAAKVVREPDWKEKVTADILAGNFAAGTKNLDEVELELCRFRGVIAHRMGDRTGARAWFSRAVESPLATAGDHINLATSLLLQGNAEDSIVHFEAARIKEPDNDYAAGRYFLAFLQTKFAGTEEIF